MKKIKQFLVKTLFRIGKFIQKKEMPLNETRKRVQEGGKLQRKILGENKDIKIMDKMVESVPNKFIESLNGSDQVILLLHGGGHVFNLDHVGDLYASYISLLAEKTRAQIWIPDYRVAPENPLPSGLDDCFKTYKYLLESGVRSDKITLLGDSAGGGLVLSLLLRLKEKDLPMPKGAITLSAWTDLAVTGESYTTRAKLDPMFNAEGVKRMAGKLANDKTKTSPDRSPLYGDLEDLPRLLMFVGGREVLHDDTSMFAEKAKKAGVDVTVIDEEKMFHVYPLFANVFPEGMDALDKIAEFVNR